MNRRQPGWAAMLALLVLLVMGGSVGSLTALGGGGGRGGGGRRGGGGIVLPGMSSGPDITMLQPQLAATDEEWTVIGPILKRLVSAIQMLDAADSGELAYANTESSGRMGGMANPTFDGPANIAEGIRFGFDNFTGGSRTPRTAAANSSTLVEGAEPATRPAAAQPDATEPAAEATEALSDAGSASDTLTLAQAIADLQAALAKPETTIPELLARLRTVRDARAKAELEAELATKELLPLLTTDQQAVLMSLGYLQ